MNKAYNKIAWQNKPSTATPLNQTNLNEMSNALDTIDDRVIALDSGKVSSVTVTNTLPTGDTIATITVDGTATNIKSAQVVVDSTPSATSENPLQNKAIYEMLNNLLPEETAEGNPISISDASGLNAKACSVDLLPIQDLHGYDNPWVGGSGKNKFNIDGFSDTQRTVVASVNNGVLHLQGTVTAGGNARFALPTTQSIPTGSVTLSVIGSNENIRVVAQGNNGFTYISQYGNFTKTFTITDTATLSYFYVDVTNGTTVNADVKIQIESGSQATTFAPYSNICPISGRNSVTLTVNGEDTEITFGQTVYGGTLDVTNGKLTIDKGTKDLGSLTWFKHSTAGRFYAQFASGDNVKPAESTSVAGEIICSQYKNVAKSYLTLQDGNFSIDSTANPYINIYDTSKSELSAGDFKTAMSGVTVCYSLATPTTLTLTAEQISLLKGNNVVSTDGDNIILKYSADIKAWVENQLQS